MESAPAAVEAGADAEGGAEVGGGDEREDSPADGEALPAEEAEARARLGLRGQDRAQYAEAAFGGEQELSLIHISEPTRPY